MTTAHTAVLGTIAGMTILLGLPVGRLRSPRPGLRAFLNATAIGVLVFLVWDVFTHAFDPIDTALGRVHDHTGGLAPVFGYGALFFGGLALGLMTLVYYERWMGRQATSRRSLGPGTMTVGEVAPMSTWSVSTWSPARRLSLLIAVGIGLHNFAEGLAIGGSAGRGAISLATLLVIGFGLHNATEGFGIVAPLAGEPQRPSWGLLVGLGIIGGGPTILGTVIGRSFSSSAVSVAFLTLAAGSILYVVIQLLNVATKLGRKEILCWGILVGLVAGFVTDMIVTVGGA